MITSGRGYYRKNPDYSFVLTEALVSGATDKTKEVSKEDIREHSLNLKDAIRTWIYDLSITEPCHEHPLVGGKSSSDVIAACENHVLFSDLTNHLPNLGSTVCSDWNTYKKELEELDKLKEILLFSIEDEIRKCFRGINLVFPIIMRIVITTAI